jgi:hypothetical protein
MIFKQQTEAIIEQNGEFQESIKMSLDMDSAQVLMQILSKNLYSEPIGSTIRETVSNALDSHRKANVTEPVIVTCKPNKDGNYEFSVEDFGIGLDDNDVRNIISKYGKSTKRESDAELGMYGLGFKSPLAYSSSFYFVCRKDGMERKYMMYEGEDVNTLDLLFEGPTSERNGVKVIVPIKYYNVDEFKRKIKEQLAYFENVFFDVDGVSNDFTIIRHEDFQHSTLSEDAYVHICLDDVYYPLDYNKLEIKQRINIPIALRFSLSDGLYPTPNREALRYNREVKDLILNKLKKVANYFVNKYNEGVTDTDDPIVAIKHYRGPNKIMDNPFKPDSLLDITELSKYATEKFKEPKVTGIDVLNLQDLSRNIGYILGEYEILYELNAKRVRQSSSYWRDLSFEKAISETVYIYTQTLSALKKDYIKHLHSLIPKKGYYWRTGYIIKKSRSYKLGSIRNHDEKTYCTILKLAKYPKDKWRQVIQEFQYIVGKVTSEFTNVDAEAIPDAFIQGRKKPRKAPIKKAKIGTDGKRKLKLEGEIICKVGHGVERYTGKNCKWVSTTYKLSDFHKNPFILVYGKSENVEKMDELYKGFNSQRVKFAIFSERELKVVKDIKLHNLIPFEEFMKGKNKPFQRLVTACIIDKLSDEHNYAFNYFDKLSDISTDLHGKMKILYEYHNQYGYNFSEEMRDSIIEHGEELKCYDTTIYHIYLQVKEVLEKCKFLNCLLRRSFYEEGLKECIIDLFKYYRYRIDWKHYKIKLNEETPLEEILTEETVEQLTD